MILFLLTPALGFVVTSGRARATQHYGVAEFVAALDNAKVSPSALTSFTVAKTETREGTSLLKPNPIVEMLTLVRSLRLVPSRHSREAASRRRAVDVQDARSDEEGPQQVRRSLRRAARRIVHHPHGTVLLVRPRHARIPLWTEASAAAAAAAPQEEGPL